MSQGSNGGAKTASCSTVTKTLLDQCFGDDRVPSKYQAEILKLAWPVRRGWREYVLGMKISWRDRAILQKTKHQSLPETAAQSDRPKKSKERQPFSWDTEGFVYSYIKRDETLQKMGYPSYGVYLTSLRWEKIRKEVFAIKGHNCLLCGERANQIHHSSYDQKTLLGKSIEALWPICGVCHSKIERDINNSKRTVLEANKSLGLMEPGNKPASHSGHNNRSRH